MDVATRVVEIKRADSKRTPPPLKADETSPPRPGPMTKRCVLAGLTEAAGACLDGSPYCFYEQLNASSARWAFFFEGGGACDDEQGCVMRSQN